MMFLTTSSFLLYFCVFFLLFTEEHYFVITKLFAIGPNFVWAILLSIWLVVEYSFGYQTGRRTGLVLWAKTSLSGKGLGQGFLNVAEMIVLVVFLD